MTTERNFMPEVSDDLPAGQRPMIAVVPAIPGHEDPLAAGEIYRDADAFKVHLGTDHVAHFFTELAQHSTANARVLTQLVELPID